MATRISNLKDANNDNVYPITKVECVYNDSNQNVSDLLATKADTDLGNVTATRTSSSVTINSVAGTKYVGKHLCIESWVATDGSQWYRKYDDGWKECGGKNSSVGGSSTGSTITIPITFSDTTYKILASVSTTSASFDTSANSVRIRDIQTTSFKVGCTYATGSNAGFFNGTVMWYCCGY